MASGGRSSTAKSSKNKAKTTAVKKNTSPAGKRKRTTKAKQQAANQLRDEVLVLLSFAVAVILLLSNFNLAGSVGVQIKWFMFGLFGVMEYIFPIVVAASLIFLISNREYIAVARVKTAAVYILMVLLSAMALRIGNRPDIAESTLMEIFHYSAVHNTGGGFFGGMLCKLLKPLGMFGSMVVLLLLIIICLIVITEKSFISGVMKMQKSGSRMVHAAKQDYDLYREHSADRQRRKPDEELSEEEYLARRREEKLKKIQEKEEKAQARMNKKARGITSATTLPKETAAEPDNPIDIHEIVVDTQREDEYSGDIYSPVQQQEQAYDYELESILTEEPEEEMINPVETESMPDETIHSLSERLEQMTGQYQEPEMYPDAYAENGSEPSAYEAYEQALPEETVEQDMEQDGYEAENAEYPEQEVMGDAEETAGVSGQPHTKVQRYQFPPLSLLNQASSKQGGSQDRENKATALRLQQTLQNFGVKVTITDISCGPAVTRYELQPEQGVKVSKIVSLSDDIKLNLAAADIRIEAPIPGKAAIGIEVPNKVAGSVSIRELLESEAFEKSASPITFAVGKDIAGKTIVADIAKMPHLLIAGATGSGKSVCINTIIMSIIYMAGMTDVNPDHLRINKPTGRELGQLEEAALRLKDLPFYLDYTVGATVEQIRAKVLLQCRLGKCDLVVVDYLHLLGGDRRKGETQEQMVGRNVRALKQLALDSNCPVLTVSQMNRACEARADKAYLPVMSDLRDSGTIEQVADCVAFIYRPERYGFTRDEKTGHSQVGVGKIYIAKNRNGSTGIARFRYNPSFTRITDYIQPGTQTSLGL